MKLLPLPLLILLSPSALAGWTLPGFPAFDETAAGLFASRAALPKGQLPLRLYQDNHCSPATPIRRPAGGSSAPAIIRCASTPAAARRRCSSA